MKRILGAAVLGVAWAGQAEAQQSPCEHASTWQTPTVPPASGSDPCQWSGRVVHTQFTPGGRPIASHWQGNGGAPTASSAFNDLLWVEQDFTTFELFPPVTTREYGARLGLNLLNAPPAGDFLPPARTLGASSLALLPAGAATASTSWQGLSRPTIDGQVDLVTGMPLVQVTDLELPLGSATFRLNRTRSYSAAHDLDASWGGENSDSWWDWTGSGWMASENPLLLVDASTGFGVGDNPKTCWLLLDATHTIPFQFIEGEGRYEAPARFRARLRHNGSGWTNSSLDQDGLSCTSPIGSWSTPPTEFEISLYEGAVKYTFVLVGEVRDPDGSDPMPTQFVGDDVPLNRNWEPGGACGNDAKVTSFHDRPILYDSIPAGQRPAEGQLPYVASQNPGFGIPWYALCTRIEDKQGHAVQIEYMESKSRTAATLLDASGTSTECVACQQDGLAKGQIKWIKLWANDSVQWTLAYVHRRVFGQRWTNAALLDADPCSDPDRFSMHGYNVIDHVYAFRGDQNLNALSADFFTIPWTDRMTSPTFGCSEHVSEADELLVSQSLSIDGGRDPIAYYQANHSGGQFLPNWEHSVRYHYNFNRSHGHTIADEIDRNDAGVIANAGCPQLLMTTMSSKASTNSTLPPIVSRRVYWYDQEWLAAYFDQDAITNAVAGSQGALHGYESLALSGPSATYAGYASAQFDLSNFGSGAYQSTGTWQTPGVPTLFNSATVENGPFFKIDGQVIPTLAHVPGVQAASVRGADGRFHHYRIHRFVAAPISMGSSTSAIVPVGTNTDLSSPTPSIFHIPYRWHNFRYNGDQPEAIIATPALDVPRWFAFIDEFETADAMNAGNQSYSDTTGLKAGQRSRRFVSMNAAGVIIQDYFWQFTPDGTSVEGGGLGRETRFQTVAQYFNQHLQGGLPTDVPAVVAGDLLPVLNCSIGWSASASQQTQGLVSFNEYRLSPDGGYSTTQYPWARRVQLTASGIQEGIGASQPKYYTQQTIYRTDVPWEVAHQIQFLSSASQPLSSYTPDWQNPPAGVAVTSYFVTRDTQPDVPASEQRVLAQTTVGAPRKQLPGSGTPWYYPVSREEYTADGQMVYSITGLVRSPDNPGSISGDPLERLVFTYTWDDGGQVSAAAIDVIPGSSVTCPIGTGLTLNPPVSSAGWQRKAGRPDASGSYPAANLATVTWRDNFGPTDVFYPDPQSTGEPGLRFARRWAAFGMNVGDIVPDQLRVLEYVYNNLKRVGGNLGDPSTWLFQSQSPGELRTYLGPSLQGASLTKTERGFFVNVVQNEPAAPSPFPVSVIGNWYTVDNSNRAITALDPAHPGQRPPFFPMGEISLVLDSNGRPAQADLLERGFDGQYVSVGQKLTNDLVDRLREKEIDGTISSKTRNLLGQHMRTYTGTSDAAWIGDQAQWDGTLGSYVDPATHAPLAHNMVLKERMKYGAGVSNALLPVVNWSYRSHTRGGFADNFYTSPASDGDGYPTVTQYDWRMRPVRVDHFDKGTDLTNSADMAAKRLATTLTYFDHAGRVYLTVEYGGNESGLSLTLPAGMDPVALSGASALSVTPDQFNFSSGSGRLRPIAMTYSLLNSDGGADETRRYKLGPTYGGTLQYMSEWRYRGFGESDSYSQSPGGPASITDADGVGRAVRIRTGLPGATLAQFYELTATENVYDEQGNLVEERRLERMPGGDGTDCALVAGTNAVRTRQIHWYDTEKRRIASADLGTETAQYTVQLPASPYTRINSGPSVTVNPTTHLAQITLGSGNESLATAKLSFSVYDTLTGNLVYSVAPNGIVSRREYGRANRLAKTIENWGSVGGAGTQRTTGYGYQYGRLIRMMASATSAINPDSPSQPAAVEVSDVSYGAEIVDENFEIRSADNSLVGEFRIPAPGGGASSTAATIRLRYTFTGKIAERIDLRGVVFRYAYDSLDRLKSVTVGTYPTPSGSGSAFLPKYPTTMDTPSSGTPIAPADRVGYVEYAYSARTGQLTSVLAKTKIDGAVISYNTFSYDAQQSLTQEVQSIGSSTVTSSTPKTVYNWTYLFSNGSTDPGHSRLNYMDYPAFAGVTARRVQFAYTSGLQNDSTQWVDDRLDRPVKIDTRIGASGTLSNVARQAFAGERRRAMLSQADDAIISDLRTGSAGLSGFDRFGRLKSLTYKTTVSGVVRTLFGAEYTYDIADNRTSALVTRASSATTEEVNLWSQTNAYDALDQLTGTKFGAISGGAIPSPRLTDDWKLDILGNWVGDPTAQIPFAGRRTVENPGQSNQAVHETTDDVNARNRIDGRVDTTYSASPMAMTYDTAGNLRCDGVYFYQYDAWNRLIQINEALPNSTFSQPPPLDQNATPSQEIYWPGRLIKHFKHDGLGRLIEVQSPYPDPTVQTGQLRTERFYYDGVRRIQELVIDPAPTIEEAQASGNGEVQQQAVQSWGSGNEASADPQTATVGLVNAAVGGANPVAVAQVVREYIWGSGDRAWGGAVDELLAQYDVSRSPWWMLSDGGGDVVAMCKKYGTGNSTYAQVAAQWTYGAYGAVVAQSTFDAAGPVNHCGHKGLFADRLEVGVATTTGGEENERLVLGADLAYYNRNRSHLPRLGRFLQSDPHAMGLVLTEQVAFAGRVAVGSGSSFDMQIAWLGGSTPYAYLNSNCLRFSDPMGLYGSDDYWHDMGDGAGMVMDAYSTFTSFSDAHGLIQSMAQELITQYAYNLETDSEWATDWQAKDNAHSRLDDKWIQAAILRGMYEHFNLEPWTGQPQAGDAGADMAAKFPASIVKLCKGVPIHHIATWYRRVGKRLSSELRKVGIGIHSAINAVPLVGHKGPHDIRYHEWMLDNIRRFNRRSGNAREMIHKFLWFVGEKTRQGVIDINNFSEPDMKEFWDIWRKI